MRVDPKCSGVLVSPKSDTAKGTEAYDGYVKAGSCSEDKGTVSRSTPVFTGQFNGRPNIIALSFSYFPSSLLVSSWSREINADPAVLDRSTYVCDTPILASCPCVCAHFGANKHTTGLWLTRYL